MQFRNYFLSLIVSFLFLSPAVGQDTVSVIGKITSIQKSAGIIKGIQVEVDNFSWAPSNVQKTWLKEKNGKTYISIRLSYKEKPAWLKKGTFLSFSIYPLEHTTEFGFISATETEEPSNERIIFCHNQILDIKPGMNRRQVEAILKRDTSNEGIFKNQTYFGCTCGIGQIWQRNIWFKPKAMPDEIYWTVNKFKSWIKKNSASSPRPAANDVVVELSEANCEEIKNKRVLTP